MAIGLQPAVATGIYNDAASVVYTTLDGLSHNQVQGFCQDRRGIIWICTWYGLDAFDGYEFHCFRPQGEPTLLGRLKQASLTDDDRILLKTSQNQTWQFSLQDYTFTLLDEMPHKCVAFKRRFVDRAGNLWQKEALGFRLIPPQSDYYHYVVNEKYPLARVLYEDAHHNALIAWSNRTSSGKSEGELIRYDLDGQPLKTLYRGNAVCAIYEDDRQNIWLGTHNEGLILLRPDVEGNAPPNYQVQRCRCTISPIFALVPDAKGRLWIGTLGDGIYLASYDSCTRQVTLTRPDSYPLEEYARVRSMLEVDGEMLIATDGGLLKVSVEVDPSQMEFHPLDASQDRSELIHLLRISDGSVLVSAFGKGIYRYQPQQETFAPFVAADIAECQAVYSMVENPDSSLWVTTQTSLRLYQGTSCYSLPINASLDMIETVPLCDNQGHCWFATQHGVLRLASFLPPAVDRAVAPTFVSLKLNDVKWNHVRMLSLADSLIILQPDERNVTVDISSLQFGVKGREHYAWRIVETDTTWHETQSHHIHLPRFSPGDYTLQVRTASGGIGYADAVGNLPFHVIYRWHETPLFRSLLFLFSICIVVTIVVLLLKVKRLQRLLLDSQPVALFSAAITEIKSEDKLTTADQFFIETLNERVRAELSDSQLSIEKLAAAMGMSRSTFYRRLKSVVGQSPNEYIHEMRLQRATELLRADADASIATIAYECGFSSPQYFSNVFRKRYHMTPNQWRLQ